MAESGTGDVDAFDDWARGRALGLSVYRPDLLPEGPRGVFRPDHHALADNRQLTAALVLAGIKAAQLDPPARHLEQLSAGIADGLDEAHQARTAAASSHAEMAHCEPDSPFGRCDYCSAYADAVAASEADRTRWNDEQADPRNIYVVGSTESMVHTRDCPTVARMVNRGGGWPRTTHACSGSTRRVRGAVAACSALRRRVAIEPPAVSHLRARHSGEDARRSARYPNLALDVDGERGKRLEVVVGW